MIVFVTDELPRPGAAGHLALNYEILDWLRAEGRDVTILLTGARLASPLAWLDGMRVDGPGLRRYGRLAWPATLPGLAQATARLGLRALPRRLAQTLRARRNRADAVLGSFASAADLRWCAAAIARLQPEAVLIDTIFRAALLAAPELRQVNNLLITHDLFHRRAEALRLAGYKVRPEGLTRQRETELLARARHITAIQPEEAAILRQMCPGADILTAPMPALPCPPPAGQMRLPGRLVFIGSDTLPNLDGLRWFLSEIWPGLRGQGITLDLIGDCGPALRALPEGVKALGRVAKLAPLLHRAALAIAPLRAGSGLKIKMLDYARHGLVTIATPAALEGFARDDAAPFIPATGAADFAVAILRHIAPPAPPEPALAYVAAHYGRAHTFAGLREALISA